MNKLELAFQQFCFKTICGNKCEECLSPEDFNKYVQELISDWIESLPEKEIYKKDFIGVLHIVNYQEIEKKVVDLSKQKLVESWKKFVKRRKINV